MSKIICDVCGTSYPSSAEHCPICGCVRPATDHPSSSEQPTAYVERPEGYTYVKGGRFSKSNVQKRNQGIEVERNQLPEEGTKKSGKNDKGLLIAVCVLLLAIIAVVVYIVLQFSGQSNDDGIKDTKPQLNPTAQTIDSSDPPQTESVLFEDVEIKLSDSEIILNSVGAVYQINATVEPQDTEDILVFTSENEEIATVSETGEIVAVSSGETVITVACGTTSVQCIVICDFTGSNGDTPSSEPVSSDETFRAPFKINKKDVMIRVGEKFTLKLTDADKKIIPVTWTAADLETCTIDGNTITGAAKGTTEVSVVYEGVTYTCIVRVI